MTHSFKQVGLTVTLGFMLGLNWAHAGPTLLFKSNFGSGVSVSAPYGLYTSKNGGWQDIFGLDSETGFSWPIKALGTSFSGIQLITYETLSSIDTIGDQMEATIQAVPGPEGPMVNELFQNVKVKGPAGACCAQASLLMSRPWNVGDVNDLYISYWFRHQPDLVEKLDPSVPSGGWRVQFEFKTGGYNNTYAGDYRIQTTIIKNTDGKLYWMSKGDNVANGPWPRVDYWIERNYTVPVPVGEWFKFEVFWHRSTGSDGRYWAAVNGQVIVDHFGPNMGDLNLPINRIFITNSYSGGYAPVESHTTGLEIWNGFPCGEGKSCYCSRSAPALSILPSSQTGAPGTKLNYNISLKNTDGATCTPSTFSLNSVLAPGLDGAFSPSSLTLAPGQQGLATLAVSSALTANDGNYAIKVNGANSRVNLHTASAAANYEVQSLCVPRAPLMTISPVKQSAGAGSTLSYSVSITNQDSKACAISDMSLTPVLPTGWSGSSSALTLSLTPAQTSTVTFNVTPPVSAILGEYPVGFKLSDPKNSIHSVLSNATFVVADVQPPTAPSSLTIQKDKGSLTLSWFKSTDNVGVVSYTIWRNGARLTSTSALYYVDKPPARGVVYSYSITATDSAGNVSSPSNEVKLKY